MPFLLAGLLLFGPAVARGQTEGSDQKRVCVFSVAGRGGGAVRVFLEKHLGTRYHVISLGRFRRAARALGIRRRFLRRANLKRIAKKVNIDAVITVWVRRRRTRWRLSFVVRDGSTGRILKSGRLIVRGRRPGRWKPGKVLALIGKGVDSSRGISRAPPEERPRPALRPRPGLEGGAREPQTARPGTEPRAATVKAARPSYLTGVEAGVGVAVGGRYFTIGPGRQVVYDSSIPISPLTVEAELFPAAFFTRHKAWANLGLGFRYHRAFGLVTVREGTNQEVDTTIQRIGGYLIYRWNLKGTAGSPILYFGVGADVLEFTYKQDMGVLPGVLFVSIQPMVRMRFPIGSRVSLSAGVSGLGVVSFGQIADRSHYGKGSAGGVEGSLELGVRIVAGLSVVAGGSTTWLFVDFDQKGTQGVDYQYAADSARDGYYGGYLRVSYAY